MKLLLGLILSIFAMVAEATPLTTMTPFSVGIYPPIQFPADNFTIKGLRLSIGMGWNREVSGIDLALIGNHTDQAFNGLAVAGLFNWNSDRISIYGAQIAGLTNINEGEGYVYGLQLAIGANASQFTDIYGAQIAIYNRARDVYGLQIGLVNVANSLHGLQIGLANFNAGGPFGVSPVINFGW